MLHLIWSLLNVIVLLYFAYLLVGFIAVGRQIFNPKLKVVSAIILVIGVVQIASASSKEESNQQIIITQDYDPQNDSTIKEVLLEDNLTFDINMFVEYSLEENEYVPVESKSYLTGIVYGYEWEFKSIQTHNYEAKKKADFTADGVLKWNLLGITVYSQLKSFKGTIN